MQLTPTVLSPVLVQPGIYNSGEGHWQTRWEQLHAEFQRVPQCDWDKPVCAEWVATLEATARAAGKDCVIVAHSLGCLAVAHWAANPHSPIKAALLVAVPDPMGVNFPADATGFAPLPMQCLPFPTIMVASRNDPYSSFAQAEHYAAAWGAKLVDIGERGHINALSGLGDWVEGLALLRALQA